MGRPGYLKDQRVTIMISRRDLDAIDQWRFANRIGSRGQAIRDLCGIALSAERDRDTSEKHTSTMLAAQKAGV
jgi:hypothetical protein